MDVYKTLQIVVTVHGDEGSIHMAAFLSRGDAERFARALRAIWPRVTITDVLTGDVREIDPVS